MNSGVNCQPVQPGAGATVTHPSGSASEEPEQIKIHGYVWDVDVRWKGVLRLCVVCEDGLGSTLACRNINHRLCQPCLSAMVRLAPNIDDIACPLCWTPFKETARLHMLFGTPLIPLGDVKLSCLECNQWSGLVRDMRTHIQVCNGPDVSCCQVPDD